MFNRLFSALENTRASISQAFRGISAGNITGEQLDNIEEQLFLADIGYDTVGQTMKNPNLQLRSDPIITKSDVGPWNQSTVEPDLIRLPLEVSSTYHK